MFRNLAVVVSALAAFPFGVLPAFAEKRVALVIGNANYINVARLINSSSDARLMADTLKGVGFTLIGDDAQIDLDEAGLRRVVQAFGNALQGADVGLFYFAGHGVQVRDTNYLVPVGANPTKEADIDFQMLDVNLVLRQMENAGTKLNIVILDACRNNPFGGRGLRATSNGLAQMQAPEGTLISYATQPGSVAQDGTDGNSPYTKALTQVMLRPGLGIFDAFNEVGLAVKTATGGAQQPWLSSSPITGTFYFAGPTSPGPTTPSATDPAAQAWNAIQNTTSIAILEEFLRTYGDSPFARFARARIDELKKSQSAAIAPPAPAAPPQFNAAMFPQMSGLKPLPAAKERTLKPSDSFKECDQCPVVVVVPSGSFMMGSPDNELGRLPIEGPQHSVIIGKPFAIGKFEVTVDQFGTFVKDTGYETGSKCLTLEDGLIAERAGRNWFSPGFAQTGAHPVTCISWTDAKAYLSWLSQ